MIEQSRIRLERLGYFKQAEVETVELPGYDDLIDVDFTVEEQSFGSSAVAWVTLVGGTHRGPVYSRPTSWDLVVK